MSEKRKRRKWKVIVVLLLLLLAAPPLFVWIVKVRSDRAWNEFVAKWEARGEHFDIAPLAPPKVPNADNLALHPIFLEPKRSGETGPSGMDDDPHSGFFPEKIEALYAEHHTEDPDNPDLAIWFNLPPGTAPADYLTHIDESYLEWSARLDALAEAVRQREHFWVEIDWAEFFLAEGYEPLSHLSDSDHHFALELRAAIRRAAGDASGCADDIESLLRLARAQADLPLILNRVVQSGATMRATEEIDRALKTGLFDDSQLRQLETELARTPSGTSRFLESLRFERALCLNFLNKVAERNDPALLEPLGDPTPISRARMFRLRQWLSANRLALCEDVQEYFLGPGGRFADLTRAEDAVERRLLGDRMNRFVAPIGHFSLRYVVRTSIGAGEQIFHTEAKLRHARIAIAIERYRLAHGAPPPSLSALVPDFLPALSVSAYDGSAIRYELRPDGTWKLSQSIPGSTPPSSAEWPLPP